MSGVRVDPAAYDGKGTRKGKEKKRVDPRDVSLDSGITFITASQPEDFKSKRNVTSVRKKAMSSYLKGHERPARKAKRTANAPQPLSVIPDSNRHHDDTDSINETSYDDSEGTVAGSDKLIFAIRGHSATAPVMQSSEEMETDNLNTERANGKDRHGNIDQKIPEARGQDTNMRDDHDDELSTPVKPDTMNRTIEDELKDAPHSSEGPLSDSDRFQFLTSLQDQWDVKPGILVSPEEFELLSLLSRLALPKVQEAMALFEAIASACPVNSRANLLSSLLQHVENELPLEQWWTTAGTGSAEELALESNQSVWEAFYYYVGYLEDRWCLEQNGSRIDEANKAYEQIRPLFFASGAKLEEAMAFFETVAGACDGDKRAELLDNIVQHVKKGLPLEQWWDPVSDNTTFATGGGLESEKDKGTGFTHEESASVWYTHADTPTKNNILPVLPSSKNDRGSSYSSEHDISVSRFATPQTLPSLTERSTISPRRMLSPWTPYEVEGPASGTGSKLAKSHMNVIKEADDTMEPEYQADRPEVHQSEWGDSYESAMSRRKRQNILAQRAFRARAKRLEFEEKEEESDFQEEKIISKLEADTTHGNMSQEVLMYQIPGEQVVIQCTCGNVNDGRFIIPCITCGTWQHIRCYYELAKDVVENHECVQCDPRELNSQGTGQAKRSAEEDPAFNAASTATQTAKRARTSGAASSIEPSIAALRRKDDGLKAATRPDYAPTILTSLSASKSNYQNLLDGNTDLGETYPTYLSTDLTSKRSSHKIAEQGRRNRVNVALQEMKTLLPAKQTTSGGKAKVSGDSKASMVESASAYIKELQEQLREKDRLLEEKNRQIEQLSSMNSMDLEHKSQGGADVYGTGETSFLETLDSTFGEVAMPDAPEHGTGRILDPKFSPARSALKGSTWNTLEAGQKQASIGAKDDTMDADHDEWDYDDDYRFYDRDLITSSEEIFTCPFGCSTTFTSGFRYLRHIKVHQSHKLRCIFKDCDKTFSHMNRFTVHLKQCHPSGVKATHMTARTAEGSHVSIKQEEREASFFDELPGSLPQANILIDSSADLSMDWTKVQAKLPEAWKWDVEYQPSHWTCTPLELDEPKHVPLTIAGAPVVLPVEHEWPPTGGVNPPPDPRPSVPIDCTVSLSLDIIRDLFLTFENSIGFYLLVNGLLQIIVSDDFDTAWASSHLPHKYGGLKVCYISQTLEPTMLPSTTETTKTKAVLNQQNTGLSSIFRQSRQSAASLNPALSLNDFIEARPKANHRKEKYAGRIGLKVLKAGEPYLVMSTHIITEAMLAKSHRETIFGRGRGRFDKLDDDWNSHVDIWAGNEKIGTIDKSFDNEAEVYPNGFHHDVTLIKPTTPASVKDIVSPISNIGWLSQDSWSSLRQNTSAVKVLGQTEDHRSAKSIKCSRPSEILVVGEGIFLNQTAAAGSSKSLKDHDMATWKDLVSRALLYRVYPDFDPPNGHSGVALYADGEREDGSHGPGIVGFQSFVQRSGHVQNFNMEGSALERRLQLGKIAFYGAFEVPEELKREYTIA